MLADSTPRRGGFRTTSGPAQAGPTPGHRPSPPRQPDPSPRPRRTPSVPVCAALHGSRAGGRAKTELALADAYRAPSQSRAHRGVQGRSSAAAHPACHALWPALVAACQTISAAMRGTWSPRRLARAAPNWMFCVRSLPQPNGPANALDLPMSAHSPRRAWLSLHRAISGCGDPVSHEDRASRPVQEALPRVPAQVDAQTRVVRPPPRQVLL
jgi:hypothetical protein